MKTSWEALKIAALTGVDVRVMIPCAPDHPFVYWTSYANIGELLAVGARAYTYDNGFIHSKKNLFHVSFRLRYEL
nr:cardiolipin synthetase [uncultured archaeon]